MSARGALRLVVGAVLAVALGVASYAVYVVTELHGWTASAQFFAAVAAVVLVLLGALFSRLGWERPK